MALQRPGEHLCALDTRPTRSRSIAEIVACAMPVRSTLGPSR
jgi:hypothetical protein